MIPKVLFLCSGNATRSQIAEGFLRNISGSRFDVLSAGTKSSRVHRLTVEVMKEVGIDISGQQPKHVQEFLHTPIDVVVTLCSSAREECPIFPRAARSLHWDMADPAAARGSDAEKLAVFRNVRDDIFAQVLSTFGNHRPTVKLGSRSVNQKSA
jgi:arsenate reductase